MIDFLRGKIAHLEPEYIVLDVRDIGYRVFTPNPYSFSKSDDQNVTVYIHHHVREDAVLLYGFESREQQRLFRKLLDVTGIGPRVAVGILAGGTPEQVITAIQQEDLTFLTKLPGIGRKTAQRMVLDLKDKLESVGIAVVGAGSGILQGQGTAAGEDQSVSAWREAREALAALGYTQAELDRAWHGMQETVTDEDTVDVLMKRALQWLFKG